MKRMEYYINTINGKNTGKYQKVSGYVESVVDNQSVNVLLIGYDKRNEHSWVATELNTGFCVNIGAFETKKKCVENVHNNIDAIVDIYNKKMTDEKFYQSWIKPFEDFVRANKNKK